MSQEPKTSITERREPPRAPGPKIFYLDLLWQLRAILITAPRFFGIPSTPSKIPQKRSPRRVRPRSPRNPHPTRQRRGLRPTRLLARLPNRKRKSLREGSIAASRSKNHTCPPPNRVKIRASRRAPECGAMWQVRPRLRPRLQVLHTVGTRHCAVPTGHEFPYSSLPRVHRGPGPPQPPPGPRRRRISS